jgi:energy-coupling factor transport system ATP-binding protein
MEAMFMKLGLDRVHVERKEWSLTADETFYEGVHLITGAVGSGKSTLALLAARLLTPSAGAVTYEGIGRVVLSLQFPEHHITGLTLTDEIASWGLAAKPVITAAKLSGRADDDPLHLSRGELKRLHLECVLRLPADLLILDEPFSGLDPSEKLRYCTRIGEYRSRGITLIFTHEQEYFPRVDQIWELQDGSLTSLGSPPIAYHFWRLAPPLIRTLLREGSPPANLSNADIQEALCRTRR